MEKNIEEIKLDGGGQKQTASKTVASAETKTTSWPKINLLKKPGPLKYILFALVGLIILIVVLGLVIGLPLFKAYQDGRKAYAQALIIKDTLKSQNIQETYNAIVATQNQVKVVKSDISGTAWATVIPFFGAYISDAQNVTIAADHGLEAAKILVTAVEPYADLLGLKGQGTFTGGTAEDRITKLVETLDKVTPQIDQVAGEMAQVQTAVDKIDPNRYPETFQGKQVRSQVVAFKDLVDVTGSLLTQARPMVKQLPQLLGVNKEAKYLILFQNDAELRPTGGFITAYAIFRVEQGKIHLNTSDDIYKLDDTIPQSKLVTPPDPISRYLNVYGWRLRDANFSPDFSSSMRTFEDIYKNTSEDQSIDGIIAMDTHVLVQIMKVIPPITIYGTQFTTEKVSGCDCAMVLYELEKYADEPKNYERGARKDIIGVLLQQIMHTALSSGKSVYGPLFQTFFDEASQKHILFYLHNTDAETGVQALNFGGQIKTSPGDYLHINDANLGGAKSNLYVQPKVVQKVTITDSGADETLTVTYTYPHAADNCSLERKAGLCLAGIYRDYMRVYLPAGAIVKDVNGYESKPTTYSDLGHAVVAGFFTVVPQGLAKITINYSVPGNFKSQGKYTSLIQKQPGTDANSYEVDVNGVINKFSLLTDKDLSVPL